MKLINIVSLLFLSGFAPLSYAGGVTAKTWESLITELITEGDATSEPEKETAVQAWRNIPGDSGAILRIVTRAKDAINEKWKAENNKEKKPTIPDDLKRYSQMNQADIATETKKVLKTYAGKEGSTAEFFPRVFGGAVDGVKDIQKGVAKLPDKLP